MVVDKIHDLELELSVEKTKAIMFRRKYKDRIPEIVIGGVNINTKRSFKYLGLIVDDELNFKEHIKTAADKGNKVLQALSRLMPNIGGPKEPRRRLLVSIVQSVLLYGAPIWGQCLKYSKYCVDKLMRVQRRATIRSCCVYRTVSYSAVNLISAIPSVDLLALERQDAYNTRKAAGIGNQLVNETKQTGKRQGTYTRWKARLQESKNGRWIITLITNLEGWCNRKHGQVDFHLTQMLSGHGCFGSYLNRIGKEESLKCHHCPAEEDDAMHSLFECRSWMERDMRSTRYCRDWIRGRYARRWSKAVIAGMWCRSLRSTFSSRRRMQSG
uniref:Reverse transcriptase n=1 Tax=Sipha flava TaxID=143950 RepID=A0A2S2QW03_9HEMI